MNRFLFMLSFAIANVSYSLNSLISLRINLLLSFWSTISPGAFPLHGDCRFIGLFYINFKFNNHFIWFCFLLKPSCHLFNYSFVCIRFRINSKLLRHRLRVKLLLLFKTLINTFFVRTIFKIFLKFFNRFLNIIRLNLLFNLKGFS